MIEGKTAPTIKIPSNIATSSTGIKINVPPTIANNNAGTTQAKIKPQIKVKAPPSLNTQQQQSEPKASKTVISEPDTPKKTSVVSPSKLLTPNIPVIPKNSKPLRVLDPQINIPEPIMNNIVGSFKKFGTPSGMKKTVSF